MISIGLTTFSDHPALIEDAKRKVRLSEYSGYFPVVELDTPFYALPTIGTITNWQAQVPAEFQFILKANRLMTLHDQVVGQPASGAERKQMFRDYRKLIKPLVVTNQLNGVLFQFPPSFRCQVESLNYLQRVRHLLPDVTIFVEFRDPSWYAPVMVPEMTQFMRELKLSLVVVDEPHTANLGVPLLATATNSKRVMMRLHGRNLAGWSKVGKDARSVRTLYDYSPAELQELAEVAKQLDQQVADLVIIFNNNAGHDAASNALLLRDLLGLEFNHLSPTQLDLF